MTEPCAGSMTFPTNYDGETTVCPRCGRRLRLHVNGKLPKHNREPRRPVHLERGTRIIA
jgi:hypothetical protein